LSALAEREHRGKSAGQMLIPPQACTGAWANQQVLANSWFTQANFSQPTKPTGLAWYSLFKSQEQLCSDRFRRFTSDSKPIPCQCCYWLGERTKEVAHCAKEHPLSQV